MDIFTFTFVFYIFIWNLFFTFIFIYSSIFFWIQSSCDSLVDYSELQTVGRCSLQINKRIQTWTQSWAKSTVLYQNENYLTSLSENFACLWRQGVKNSSLWLMVLYLNFTFIFIITFIFYSETWSPEQCCDPGDYPLGQVSFHRESAIWLKFKKSNKVYTENQQFGQT